MKRIDLFNRIWISNVLNLESNIFLREKRIATSRKKSLKRRGKVKRRKEEEKGYE